MKKPKHVPGKRWGKKFEDKRDWQEYNEELVARGEFLLDLDWVKSWHTELEEMNAGKRGAPYQFPETLIGLQAVWNQWIGLRQVEGITRRLVKYSKLPACNDYSTVSRRIQRMDTSFELPKHGFCSASTDGSGMKMNQAGEYKYDKYGRKKPKKWLRVVITANPLTKDLLDLEINVDGEGPSEPEIAMTHLNCLWKSGITVDKFWGDGAFDVLNLFNLLEQHNTESAIPPRENATHNANGSMRRLWEVFEYQTKSWKDWARDKQYGKRWLGTEGIFSSVKRLFGEKTRAKTVETMCNEIRRRFWAYEKMRKYAQI
ncbi:MAG: IS5 family transposase [Nitrospirota bacterium]